MRELVFFRYYIYVSAAFIFLFFHACRPQASQENLNKITELENIIINIENNLSIDEEEISDRMDSIKIMLNFLEKNRHDSGDVETRGAMLRYEGIRKNYENYLLEYPSLMYDLDKYKSDVAILKKDLFAGNIPAGDFQKQYLKLKAKLQAMDKHAATLSYNTYSIEGDYRRSHEKVRNLYNAVKSRKN